MSTFVPRVGLNTQAGAQTTNLDVYARVMQSNQAIEDVFIIDGVDVTETESKACTCGMCDAPSDAVIDFESDQKSKLAGAPMLYIETRANADPVVLDEFGISADIEIISPRMIAKPNTPAVTDKPLMDAPTPQWSQVSFASLIDATLASSFDPLTFDPYDPGVAVATDLL